MHTDMCDGDCYWCKPWYKRWGLTITQFFCDVWYLISGKHYRVK